MVRVSEELLIFRHQGHLFKRNSRVSPFKENTPASLAVDGNFAASRFREKLRPRERRVRLRVIGPARKPRKNVTDGKSDGGSGDG